MSRAPALVALLVVAACDHGAHPERTVANRSPSRPPPAATPAVVSAPAAAAPESGSARAPEAAPVACARQVTRDLAAWKAALLQARAASKTNALLAELALAPVDRAAKLVRLDVDKAAFATGARADRVVVAEFHVDSPPSDSARVQVLRALGKNAWCVVKSELSVDQAFGDRACLGGGDDDPPVQVALVRLVAPDRDALRVVTEQGHCEGCGRVGHYDLAYYDASGFELRSIYSQVLYDASYSGCPWPPTSEQIGTHELVGDFPRTIVATEETVCHDPPADAPEEYKTPCAPKVDTIHYEYQGGTYVQTVESSRDGVQDSRLALADSDFRDLRHGAGWGNRCLAHLKAGELEYARAACERGLAGKPPDAVRAALYYNLALIDEADKDTDGACRNLVRSLIARPRNEPAEEKLHGLGCKP